MQLNKAVALAHLSEVMMTTSDPAVLSRFVIDHLHQRLGYRRCAVLLKRRGAPRLQVYHRCPAQLTQDQQMREAIRVNTLLQGASGGVLDHVMRARKGIIVSEVDTFDGYIRSDAAMRAEAAFPLMADGECLGVLDAESETAWKFDWEDHLVLTALAAQLGQVLSRRWDRVETDLSEAAINGSARLIGGEDGPGLRKRLA